MAKKLNQLQVQDKLTERGMLIFSPLEFRRVFNVSANTANFFINYNLKTGMFFKLKKGLYALRVSPPSELEIANRVYSPSYVSLECAMMHYSIIPDTVYETTSITTKRTCEFVINGIIYSFSKIKKPAFSGYLKKSVNGNIVLIAEPEKAFVDYLYFVDLGKKVIYDRINVKGLSRQKVIEYAKLFNRASLSKLVKQIYDQSKRNREIIY